MKIKPAQLEQHIASVAAKKAKLSSAYLVSGDEPLQTEECSGLVRKQATQSGFKERIVLHTDSGFDWSKLHNALASLSLFSQGGTLVELRTSLNKIPAPGAEIIEHFCQHISPSHILLIISNRIERATERKKWFVQLEKLGIWTPVWPVDYSSLPGWIAVRMKKEGLTADPDAISLLAEKVEGNLLAAAQEIEKLKLASPETKITDAIVRQSVANSAHYDVFALTDAILSGNESQIIRIFYGLLAEGKEPAIILWTLSRELRLMCTAARNLAKGEALSSALKNAAAAHKIPEFTIKRRHQQYARTLKNHHEYGLRLLLNKAAELDAKMKTGDKYTTSGDELLTLALLISGNSNIYLSELVVF